VEINISLLSEENILGTLENKALGGIFELKGDHVIG
jgi:hypothetical protein